MTGTGPVRELVVMRLGVLKDRCGLPVSALSFYERPVKATEKMGTMIP
jgi:hypothetical protein